MLTGVLMRSFDFVTHNHSFNAYTLEFTTGTDTSSILFLFRHNDSSQH